MVSHRNFTVHAHFYQPPREDPLTNQVPFEPTAHPFHDWNEKIYQTCYRPNIEIGNFSKIGFNLGPTLTSWLRQNHPEGLAQIVAADRSNVEKSGHGNAIGQPYHHTILPLATKEEKETEITWGIRDFQLTYGRNPEGMWLPETAVDTETLVTLAENGIRFTILAPWQAKSFAVDHRYPHLVKLSGSREIIVLFYSGHLSSQVSFDSEATINADHFVENHVRREFHPDPSDQVVMIATDGELYGHHQSFREMFLSQMVNGALSSADFDLTFPTEFLANHHNFPEIEINEETSWSCHHGIDRWRRECGCTPKATWKQPLRDSLNLIAADLDDLFVQFTRNKLRDPWQSRKTYIDVLLGQKCFETWLNAESLYPLDDADRNKINILMKGQIARLRMFASCGWFFEDFDRIEPQNNIINSAYAVWQTENALGINIQANYQPLLCKVRDERSGLNGNQVFLRSIDRFCNSQISRSTSSPGNLIVYPAL